MNKKELKQRGKGLLALLLAFMMMFGSSMTVFAGEVNLDSEGLKKGLTLEGGDIIKISSGSLIVKIDNHEQTPQTDTNGGGCIYVALPAGHQYLVNEYKAYQHGEYSVILSTVSATPSGSTGNASTESGSDDTGNEYWKSHVHTFSWVTTQEATAEQDGIQENRCSC